MIRWIASGNALNFEEGGVAGVIDILIEDGIPMFYIIDSSGVPLVSGGGNDCGERSDSFNGESFVHSVIRSFTICCDLSLISCLLLSS